MVNKKRQKSSDSTPQSNPVSLLFKNILIQLGLIALASILFAGSFPNPVFKYGLPFLAWFAFIPILLLINRNGILPCIGWGAIYGYASYGLFNYWLGAFHPMAGLIVYGIYMFFLALVFLFLKLSDKLYSNRSYLVQWVIWLAYEYLCTQGFLGYPYGISGYSQWRFIPLIQIASITGVWGVCALVTFPSFYLAAAFKNIRFSDLTVQSAVNSIGSFFNKEKISAVVWAVSLAAALIFGVVSLKDFSGSPQAHIALIQHNTDPWEASKAQTSWHIQQAYQNDLNILIRLSDEALASDPKPSLVVWPETAFVPRIHWHSTYRDDQSMWLIVRDLLEYLAKQDVPFLIGNDDARMDPDKNPDPYERYRVDYNAALLFENGQISRIYRKLHLVPFTEHFPYEKQLPFVYNALREADTHFWEKGEEETVFQVPGFAFSSPICFEDTFGYISRNFVRAGADVLVNISNDAWANSLSAQYQHLSMAVFRAVENYRPMVRSTASGQTCAIDPLGRVIAEAPAFTETWITVNIPLVKRNTFYTKYGDFLGLFFVFTSFILLLSSAIGYTIKKLKRGQKQ